MCFGFRLLMTGVGSSSARSAGEESARLGQSAYGSREGMIRFLEEIVKLTGDGVLLPSPHLQGRPSKSDNSFAEGPQRKIGLLRN